MATLYFNNAVDVDWSELGNWWTDDTFTTQATSLPTSSDDVVVTSPCETNSGSEPTVASLIVPDTEGQGIGIAITVTGTAAFYGGSYIYGTLTGNPTFNDSAGISSGTVIGNATFNDYGFNDSTGTVSGDATFNDYSYNGDTVTGDATFNDSANNGGTVTGNATFNDSANNGGTVTGDATFNDSANNGGTVSGNATFNDSAANTGGAVVNGNATFYGSSYNDAGVDGDIIIVGGPVQTTGRNSLFTDGAFFFTRAQLGINGSSILGVI